MALRLLEIFHKGWKAEEIARLLEEHPVLQSWHDRLPGGETVTRLLMQSEDTEAVLNAMQECCTRGLYLRAVILPGEAAIPRPAAPETEGPPEKKGPPKPERISIEELYQKVSALSGASRKHLVMVTMATVIAAIGLMRNDVAIIIGSMVIAPLLGPNMGLVLALATGVAGAYSITTGVSEAFVGVMVAVALLPPLAAAGLLFGAGHTAAALRALVLFLVNVSGINLSGTVTFVLQGVRPMRWWKAEKARRAVRRAVVSWVAILMVLAALILLEAKLL